MTELEKRCEEIAELVVPKYNKGSYSCSSHTAKRWWAAYLGAYLSLGGQPDADLLATME